MHFRWDWSVNYFLSYPTRQFKNSFLEKKVKFFTHFHKTYSRKIDLNNSSAQAYKIEMFSEIIFLDLFPLIEFFDNVQRPLIQFCQEYWRNLRVSKKNYIYTP